VPKIPETEDWKVLRAPKILVTICEKMQIHDYRVNEEDLIFEEEAAAAAADENEILRQEAEMNPGDIIDDNMINDDARN